MTKLYGGVETGGTWCVCALGTGPGELVAHERFPTTSPQETIERIIAFFSSDAHPAPVGIGLGSFGPVDLDPRSSTWGSVTTTPKPGWAHTPVAGVLRERLGVPVAFDTDVNAAALGEQRWGAGRDAPSLGYVTVGTGVGAGLLVSGRPLHGLVHPEVGHLRIPHDTARDPFGGVCPFHGDCWEGLACGPAVRARWGADGRDLPDEHPAWALEAEYLALGILSIVMVASPHRVILGGGVMEREPLLGLVRAHLREILGGYLGLPLLGEDIDRFLVRPELDDDAGVLGALALAQQLESAPIRP